MLLPRSVELGSENVPKKLRKDAGLFLDASMWDFVLHLN